jgi:hypothetical protein
MESIRTGSQLMSEGFEFAGAVVVSNCDAPKFDFLISNRFQPMAAFLTQKYEGDWDTIYRIYCDDEQDREEFETLENELQF